MKGTCRSRRISAWLLLFNDYVFSSTTEVKGNLLASDAWMCHFYLVYLNAQRMFLAAPVRNLIVFLCCVRFSASADIFSTVVDFWSGATLA